MKIYALIFLASLALIACASDEVEQRLGNEVDTSETSQADGAAYVVDAMSPSKWETIRPANNDEFYFKTCEQVDDKSFYSMTSYDCTVP